MKKGFEKKWYLRVIIGFCIASMAFAGCSAAKTGNMTEAVTTAEGSKTGTVAMADTADSAGGLTESGIAPEAAGDASLKEAFVDVFVAAPGEEQQRKPEAGLLTAGEWCDNENWGFYANLINTGRFSFDVYGLHPYERAVVHALADGQPVKQIKAELYSADGAKLSEAVTDYSGTAYLYYNISDGDAAADHIVLTLADGTQVTESMENAEITQVHVSGENRLGQKEQTQPGGAAFVLQNAELTIEIAEPAGLPQEALDVMFVFDTTGSMGDELMYLQKEFEDIAERICGQSTRYSVNFYRDFGDEYVVRSHDFMTDISGVAALIHAECAEGGGDYEEAVDLALKNAVLEHEWREAAVKLMFFILDAPAHDTAEVAENLKQAVMSAAAQGIRVIPIASSGVDERTEALLRTVAMISGGTYTFLTNDSGIGGSHLEPTIGDYQVEQLNDMIVRIVQKYMQ